MHNEPSEETVTHWPGAPWATWHDVDDSLGEVTQPEHWIFHRLRAGDEDGIHVEMSRSDRLRFDAAGGLELTTEGVDFYLTDRGDGDLGQFNLAAARAGLPDFPGVAPDDMDTLRRLIDELVAAYDQAR